MKNWSWSHYKKEKSYNHYFLGRGMLLQVVSIQMERSILITKNSPQWCFIQLQIQFKNQRHHCLRYTMTYYSHHPNYQVSRACPVTYMTAQLQSYLYYLCCFQFDFTLTPIESHNREQNTLKLLITNLPLYIEVQSC